MRTSKLDSIFMNMQSGQDNIGTVPDPVPKGLRAALVVRSKLAEDRWTQSQAHGVRQYVILGAGLDTFAYRNQDHVQGFVFVWHMFVPIWIGLL
jgi:O-methyltransferase involved in polyketide biosynthesis